MLVRRCNDAKGQDRVLNLYICFVKINVIKKRMLNFYTLFNYVMEKRYDGPSVKEKINLNLFSLSHLVLRKKGDWAKH